MILIVLRFYVLVMHCHHYGAWCEDLVLFPIKLSNTLLEKALTSKPSFLLNKPGCNSF